MGVDGDLTSIIHDIVQFLESLYDVELPSKIENVRVNLLQRSKTKLASLTSNGQRGSASPEPYLDMNAGKGFLLFPKKKNSEIEIEEYVGLEDQQQSVKSVISSNQDYYESFQEILPANEQINNDTTTNQRRRKSWRRLSNSDDQVENKIREIYRTFTAAKTSSRAQKSGTLCHKSERKPFGFVRGNVRPCWIGLVGSHLLLYGSEDDKQSPEIYPIRGYSARPAPSSMSRDPERAKCAFEIFCPGNKTLQFIAKSPEEMEEWLTAINRKMEKSPETEEKYEEKAVETKGSSEEKYQDVGELQTSPAKSKESSKIVTTSCENNLEAVKRNSIISPVLPVTPPALPVRTIPRSLPSLPSEKSAPIASYEPLGEAYEEDDIYHKIEDFRESEKTSYENVKKKTRKFNVSGKKRKKRKENKVEAETYDDVESKETSRNVEETIETYDDVRSVVRASTNCLVDENSWRRDLIENPEEFSKNDPSANYDDVRASPSKVRKDKKIEGKESTKQNSSETNGGTKSPQKRSFLDRVRNRKDSPKKESKKRAKETSSNEADKKNDEKKSSPDSSVVIEHSATIGETELPTYDDVSELTLVATNFSSDDSKSTNITIRGDDNSNYNCPPPPRPIYAKPPGQTIPVTSKIDEEMSNDEVYDDIGIRRDEAEATSPRNNSTFCHTVSREKIAVSVQTEDFNGIIEKDEKNIHPDDSKNPRCTSRDVESEKKFFIETEHYQTPRKNSVRVDDHCVEQHQDEQLYDDIAILEDFRAKQRDSSTTQASSIVDSTTTAGTCEKSSNVAKKPWNRFGSGKKISSRDSSLPQTSTTKNFSCELENCDVSESVCPIMEKNETAKLNKLQKLIYKMENTLGKQPSNKSVTPFFNRSA